MAPRHRIAVEFTPNLEGRDERIAKFRDAGTIVQITVTFRGRTRLNGRIKKVAAGGVESDSHFRFSQVRFSDASLIHAVSQ